MKGNLKWLWLPTMWLVVMATAVLSAAAFAEPEELGYGEWDVQIEWEHSEYFVEGKGWVAFTDDDPVLYQSSVIFLDRPESDGSYYAATQKVPSHHRYLVVYLPGPECFLHSYQTIEMNGIITPSHTAKICMDEYGNITVDGEVSE